MTYPPFKLNAFEQPAPGLLPTVRSARYYSSLIGLFSCTSGEEEQKDSRFCQLVMLYGELIRRDVFSHNAYLCALISRGDLESTSSTHSASENVLISQDSAGKVDSRNHELLHETIIEVKISDFSLLNYFKIKKEPR